MGKPYPGPRNPNWRGGRVVARHGYVLRRVGVGHRLADVRGYAYEHRLIAEEKLGRQLGAGEIVHHKDGNRANNEPANLEVMASIAHHRVEHRKPNCNRRLPGEENQTVTCECGCGTTFPRFDKYKRPRRYVSGHNPELRNG